jgi:hypothetical protein
MIGLIIKKKTETAATVSVFLWTFKAEAKGIFFLYGRKIPARLGMLESKSIPFISISLVKTF